jgi:hypothetical protein
VLQPFFSNASRVCAGMSRCCGNSGFGFGVITSIGPARHVFPCAWTVATPGVRRVFGPIDVRNFQRLVVRERFGDGHDAEQGAVTGMKRDSIVLLHAPRRRHRGERV